MIREEAITILNHNVSPCLHGSEWGEALDMAIKALEVPCEDCISRQAAIDAFEKFIHELGIEDEPYNYGEMALSAKNVPPVTPQPKTGKWIYKQYDGYPECGDYHCSECDKIDNHIPAYCPHCGCAMIEPQERSEDAT